MNEKDVPMIEQYKADNAIIHASRIVRDLKIIVAVGAALVLLIVFIFVSFYSNRQKDFLIYHVQAYFLHQYADARA